MSLDREILSYLLASNSGERSIIQIAKAVNQPTSTVEYHVLQLVEKKVVVVKNPASTGTIRRYGRKYYLNPTFKTNPTKSLTLAILCVGATIVGLTIFPLHPLYSALCLIPSSILGAFYTIRKYRELYERSLKRMLAEL